MSTTSPYLTILQPRYLPLEVIQQQELTDACSHPWYNETLCQVNDSVVRLGVIQGEYHWHKHEKEDEFFYVVEGKLMIDLVDPRDAATSIEKPGTITLDARTGVVIPKGVLHRPRAPQRTVILMVETDTITPTGS